MREKDDVRQDDDGEKTHGGVQIKMKKWTQAEIDALKCGSDGILRIDGDLRGCNLYGRNRVYIGADSIIGDNCHVGAGCHIGENCQIGKGFSTGQFAKVGDNCHIGENAHIGFGSRIGSGCCLASGCTIEEETVIAEDAELPTPCVLYGVNGVIGRTRMTLGPVKGRRLQAVKAVQEGETRIYVHCTGLEIMPIEDMASRAARMMREGQGETWRAVMAALSYIAAHYGR